jgi:hypothetical protein
MLLIANFQAILIYAKALIEYLTPLVGSYAIILLLLLLFIGFLFSRQDEKIGVCSQGVQVC